MIGFPVMATALIMIHAAQSQHSVTLSAKVICSESERGRRICDDGSTIKFSVIEP